MNTYAEQLPTDKNSNPLQGFPSPFPANASWTSENATTSSILNLGHDTTMVEVAAINTGVAIKWITSTNSSGSVVTAAGSANFDHVVPNATYRRFVVPRDTTLTQNPQSVQGVNRAEGLYNRLAIKSLGVSSVLTTEY